MAELGVAYVSVVPSFKGVRSQIEAGMVSPAAQASQTVGRTMGSRLSSGLVTASKVAGASVAGVLGLSLTKGFARLSAIENAKAKLTGLGNSAAATSTIMDNALAAVKGTAFGMDEAATTAASAVAAGIEPGQKLQSYLGLVGDAATIAGVSMQDMGSVFNKVVTSGKVQGDTFAQMSDMGIPVVQMLAKSMHVSAEEVYALGSKGKISSDQFLEAMGSMKGAALQGGNTTTGAFKNMNAALSRFGAALLTGIYPAIGPVFNTLTTWIDKATDVAGPLATTISEKLGNALRTGAEAVARFITPLRDLMNLQVLTPEIVERMGLSPTSPLGKGMTQLIGGIRAFSSSWSAFDGDVTSSGFPGFMERAAFGIRSVWESLRNLDFSSWDGFKASLGSSGQTIANQFGSIGSSLVTLQPALGKFMRALPTLAGSMGGILLGALTAVTNALAFLADHVDTIVRFMPAIVAGYALWRAGSAALRVETDALMWAQLKAIPFNITNNTLRILAATLERDNAKALAVSNLQQRLHNGTLLQGVTAKLRATAALVAQRVATAAVAGAQKAAAAAQWLLNAAMSANPIGLVVIALTALVAGLVWFFTQTKLGQQIWTTVWNGIKAVVAGIVVWFQTYVLPILVGAIRAIGAGFSWLYQNIVLPVFGFMRAVITTEIRIIGAIFTWLYNSIILPVWNGIRVTIAVVVAVVMTIFQALAAAVRAVLAPVFRWLRDVIIVPVWNRIRGVISSVGAWFTNVLVPFMRGGLDVLGAVFRWLRDVIIVPVWNRIRSVISSVGSWFANVLVPLLRGALDVLGAVFRWLYDSVIHPVWSAIHRFIQLEVTGLTRIWNGVVSFMRDVFGPIFTWLHERIIQPVWDGISKAINGSVTFIRDSVLTPLGNFLKTTVVDSFNKARDGIKTAWDKIQDIVKTPVKFVIDTVIKDGFVKNFNSIASKFGIDKIDFQGTAGIPGFYDGGWTGPGGKYTPAGLVHADEFVISKDARRQFEKDNPGVLDIINQTGALPTTPPPATRNPRQGEAYTAPPHGPGTEVWGSLQTAASQAGHMYFPSGNFMGVDIESAARAWMGQSAMEVRLGNGSPGIKAFRTGGNGGWGFEDSTYIWMQASVPQNRRRGVLIHEMGHALGLAHPAMGDSSTIMDHMMTHTPDWPSGDDYRALRDLWGAPGKGVKKYEYDGEGGGGGSILGALYDATVGKLLDGLIEKIPGSGFAHDLLTGGAKKLASGIREWVTGQDGGGDAEGEQTSGAGSTAQVRDWISQALKATGDYSEAALNAGVRRAMQESAGNPNAVNNWDSNARNGTPSKGLMQVIGPTFKRWALPGHGNILNPVDNAIAATRYTKAEYGSLLAGWGRAGGYAEGGRVKPLAASLFDAGGMIQPRSGLQLIDHQRDTPDYVLTDRQWELAKRGLDQSGTTGAGGVYVTVDSHPGEDPTTTGRRAGESLAFHLGKALL